MLRTYELSDPGEGLLEADVLAWRVEVGDVVEINDVLAEVETAKSVVELPSPYAGTVRELLVSEGTTVAVGAPMLTIEDAAEQASEAPPTLVGYGPANRRRGVFRGRLRNAESKRRRRTKPSERDEAPAAQAESGWGERRVPIRGVRKATAANLVRSVTERVHVTEWVTVDVSATMTLVEGLKQRREFAGVRVSPTLICAKAICLALGRTPEMNASWDEQAQEIVYREAINLGVAAATPRGLMVPNVKHAEQRTLLELGQELNRLVAVARDGELQPSDYAHGTFTLTNVGVFGIDFGTPVINGDETGICCLGAIRRQPWVVGEGATERVEPRWVTTISVTFDHRVCDGEQGSRFLGDVAALLADPGQALLF